MKRLGIIILLAAITTAYVLIQGCTNSPGTTNVITPVQLPKLVPGFNFPENQDTILNWLANKDTISMYKHAWGIWAGLTANSGEVFAGDSLPVYETWLGVEDVVNLIDSNKTQGGCNVTKNRRLVLAPPRQAFHGITDAALKAAIVTRDPGFMVSVAYSPAAACYATTNSIFRQSTFNKYASGDSIWKIPPFPDSSITTKPTYYIVHTHDNDSLIPIPVWPGEVTPADSMPRDSWKSYVFIDPTNSQPKGKIIIPANNPHPAAPERILATANLNDFIHFTVDSSVANQINLQTISINAKKGDIAVLVAMHVGTKEISNWTWQTYFWSANPNGPKFPSCAAAAAVKPSQHLSQAAAHYAVAIAYTMVWPNQPVNMGSNSTAGNTNVTPLFAYNPYLEGPFGPSTFQPAIQRLNKSYVYGMQTNCMSCHAMANDNPNQPYVTDQYISMGDTTLFKGYVQADFGWSVVNNLIQDVGKHK